MRILLYIMILSLLLLAPVRRLDVAKLEPVQTVAIRMEDGQVVLETDTKNRGRGGTVGEAVESLENNTPGVIYLDTAQYLLVEEQAKEYALQLGEYLKPKVKVSLWDGKSSVETAAKYLEKHKDLPTLSGWKEKEKNNAEKS